MVDAKHSDANEPDSPEDLDDLMRWAWEPALRMALDCHGAPGRCKRRACAKAGACRMTVRQGEPLDCGGGVTDEALKTASVAALFGSVMVRQFVVGDDPAP